MRLDRRSLIPGLLTAAAVPAAGHAFGLRPERGATAVLQDPGVCEAAPLHAEIRDAALERVAEGARAEDLMRLTQCPLCGCGTLAGRLEDASTPVQRG